MDPVTVFSLVCGVIQIVDTSMEVAKKCRELYKMGASPEDREIENMAKYLVDLYQDLDHRAQAGPGELQDLCSKCSNTAQQLCTEVQKLKVNGPHRKREAVVNTVKAVWKKSAIEEIQTQLDGYQKLLDTTLLVDLRKTFHLSALQQSEGFENLDQKVQTIITKLAQCPQSFEEMRTLMRLEDESIKRHVTHQFEQHRKEKARKRYCQLFLESLHYPEILRRQDTVTEAHQKTFHWVYDTDGFDKSARGWQSIAEWLENGDGVYWINGKAGSGKSTLMNYLSHHERTLGLLRVWSGTKKILSPKHFFWSVGTTLEKSVEGLLRSLLYQILREVPSLIPVSCEHRSTLVSAKDCPDNFGPIATWTVRRLRTTFQTVIRQMETTYCICIFIDGLDEISGDPDVAIGEITSMTSFGIKVCLSSRPERSFNDAFDSCAKLRLQDLTEHDIRGYVTDRLEPWLRAEAEDEVSKMLNDIAQKAQGVFLWVDLVVKALIKGLKNDDSLEQLQMRVASTPSDIEAVYAKMLGKIEEPHRKEAARLFQMALVSLTYSFLDVALGLYDHFDRASETSVSEVLEVCRRAQNRIPTICGGLLDIDMEARGSLKRETFILHVGSYLCLPIKYTSSSDTADLCFFERYVHITFIHRTAADFLSQNKQGQSFLNECPQPCPSPYATTVRGRLAKVKLLGLPENPSKMNDVSEDDTSEDEDAVHIVREPDHSKTLPVEERLYCLRAYKFIHGLMELLCLDEWLVGAASVSLCHDVDRTLTAVYGRNLVVRARSTHWSMPWGLPPWVTPDVTNGSSYFRGASQSQSSEAHPAKSNLSSRNRPDDFLGHAASWSLSCYVTEEVDQQKKFVEKDYMTYLLCCAMRVFKDLDIQDYRNESLSKSLDLVANLLSRGADPNVYVEDFSTTLWGYFIISAPWNNHSVRESLLMTTRSFVENEADIHKTLRSRTLVCESPESQPPLGEESLRISLSWERSIPHYLHAHVELQEIMLAKGAPKYSNYHHIIVNPQTHRLSRKQHNKWLANLNAGYVFDNDRDSSKMLGIFVSQLRKYYTSNPGKDEDSDIQIDWEGIDDQDIDLDSFTIRNVVDVKPKSDFIKYQPIDG